MVSKSGRFVAKSTLAVFTMRRPIRVVRRLLKSLQLGDVDAFFSTPGYHSAFVDCETGELIGRPEKHELLRDCYVLQIPLRELDAVEVYRHLNESRRYPKFLPDADRNDNTRIEIQRATGLLKNQPYRRTEPIVVVQE